MSVGPSSCCRASSDSRNRDGVESGGGAWRVQSAVIFLSHPIHHIHKSPCSIQREIAIKAKMPNYAWLSTIKDSAGAIFRDQPQLRGPFSAIAELSAVILGSFGEFRERKEGKKKNPTLVRLLHSKKLEHFVGQR